MDSRPRHPNANTVRLDGDKFRRLCWRHRLTLNAVGPLIGRCEGWGSVIARKGHAGYFALDDLATELGLHVDDLISQIGTPDELERLSVAG